MRAQLFLLLLTAFFFTCTPPEQLLQSGQYDAAIRRYSSNLRKPENVRGLETAYRVAHGRDLAGIDSLLGASAPDWPAVQAGYYSLQKRQKQLAKHLPILARDGYIPQFDWLENIDSLERDAREKAAEQLYTEAEALLETARTGNPVAARTAYYKLKTLQKRYYPVWRASSALIEEAWQLGAVYVLVEQQSGTSFYGWNFLDYLNLGFHLRRHGWAVFHTSPQTGISYSFKADLSVERLDVGWENRSETTQTYTKDIQAGEKVVYDSSGQVVERTPIYETVSAGVTEIRITKSADVQLFLSLSEIETGTVRFWDVVTETHTFDQTWVSTSGDSRALPGIYFSTGIGIPCAPGDWSIVSDLAGTARYRVLCWFESAIPEYK